MALPITDTLKRGLSDAVTRNGFLLVVAYLVASLLQLGLVYAVTTTVIPVGTAPTPTGVAGAGPAPGSQLPALVAAQASFLVGLVGGFLTIPVQIVVYRTFASERTDRITDDVLFHRTGWATVNVFVGNLLTFVVSFGVLLACLLGALWAVPKVLSGPTLVFLVTDRLGWVVLGLAALVVCLPAMVLWVSLTFVGQEIALRDANALGALVGSWRRTSGSRLRLAVLLAVPMIPHVCFAVAVTIALPSLGQFVVLLESAVLSVVVAAIMVRAYVQLAGSEAIRFADDVAEAN